MKPYENVKQSLILWLAHRLPPCEDIARILSESQDRPLSLRERITTRLHLGICVWCRRYAEQLAFLHEAIHRHADQLTDGLPSPEASLSAEARERIQQALSKEPYE